MHSKKSSKIIPLFGSGAKSRESMDSAIEDLFKEAAGIIEEAEAADEPGKSSRKSRRSGKAIAANQSISGNNNIQIGGSVESITINSRNKKTIIKTEPPEGSIGANNILRQRIESLLNELGLRREDAYGKTGFQVMYSNLKKDLGIPKTLPWTSIWLFPESRAEEIVNYVQGKLNNTVKGRIERATSRKGYKHTRGHMFRLEKELLGKLDLEPGSSAVRDMMFQCFRVRSRKDLSDNDFRNWVAFLEGLVRKQYGSDY